MLGCIAFSVYEWLKCALARHSFLIVEGSIDKMKNIYPLNSRFTLPFAFVLAVSLLVVSLMFVLPGGALHAQTATIEYPENGTDAVATFTAVDPEGASITWTLAGADMEDFDIENGVLRFKSPPDFEDPQGGGNNNNSVEYTVTVRASDGGNDTTDTEDVTIEVTNVEEPGTVTLSTLQPQVGVIITAMLTDPDTATANTVTWQWYRGDIEIVGATNGAGTTSSPYTPTTGDVGGVLRATAMYDDTEGEDKTAQEDSAHAVRQSPSTNVPPTFPNQAPGGTATTAQTREVAENTPPGTNLGDPVVASDPDVLTYSLDTTGGNALDAAAFSINRATGQLNTKADLDFENDAQDNEFVVTVKATDPFGASDMSVVTITVTDVNEAPMVEGADSIDHAEFNAPDSAPTQVAELGAVPPGTTSDVDDYTASDVDAADPDTDLKWTLSGADASKFQFDENNLDGATRTLEFKANPDYESPGDSGGNNVYEVTVKVTDSKGNSDEQDVTVKVTNIEELGEITLSTLQPRVGFPVTATLTDPDNIATDSLSWQWYDDTPDETNLTQNAIEDATSATYIPVADDIGDTLTARATYSDGYTAEGDDDDDVATMAAANLVLVDTRNKAPVFPDQDMEMEGRQTAQERSVLENTASGISIGVDAPVAATDEDTVANRDLTYSLGGPDAASFDIVRESGQLQTKAELDRETKDTYTVTVTATDSLSASSTITVTIKVDNQDEMPDLEPDLEGEAPEEYAENGTRPVKTFTAVDPEGESIVWSLATGGDRDAFTIMNGVLRFESPPDFEVPVDNGTDNTYDVTVQASDGGAAATATQAVSIAITNVEEPGTVTLSTLQPQVGAELMATLADPDTITVAGTISWQWYRGSDPIAEADDGESTTSSSYIPAAGDVGSVLRATATYRDAEDEDNDKTAQEVSYRSVRRAPATNTDPLFPDQDLNMPGVQTAQTREVAENTSAGTNLGAPIAASDSGDVLTYSLDDGTDAAAFDITRTTGRLMTKAALDHETKETYTVTVTATDPFGATATATSQVTITVTDVNEAPVLAGGAASIDRAENGTDLDDDTTSNVMEDVFTVTDEDVGDDANGLTWSLSGADADKFEITGNNAMRTLAFRANPDYESPGDSGGNNVYEVTVKVTDSDGNSDEQDVTVKVTNIEEDGEITLSTLQPRVGFPVTATLTDPDNITEGSVSWQWYKGSVAVANLATIVECDETTTDNCAIKDATSDTYTAVSGDATDVGDTLNAVATYIDGSPNVGDMKDAVVQPTAQQVLADTRNKAPVFPDQDTEMEGRQTAQERMIGENVPVIGGNAATILVRPIALVTAMDSIIAPETGIGMPETLTYSLGGPDADSFSIDRATAQLSTKAVLDYETKDTYTVTVTATDPSDETATITVTIKVTDVDEAPTITVGGLAISGRTSVSYTENGTDAVATYMVTGPNAASARWSLEGDDAGDFNITTGGELRFNASPDYDAPRDADTNNVYKVTVQAADGTYMATRDVTVTVTDDGEVTPTISGPPNVGYAENDTGSVATYMLSANAASAAWTLEGPDADDFTIDSGVLVFKLPPDYERKATYMITVKADGATYDVTITVTDVDEALTAISGPSDVDYAENDTDDVATFAAMDPDGTAISWTLEGTDADVFDISNGGVLTFKSPPDYETKTNYTVTVKATAGTDMATPHQVTVTVTDVNEALTAISGPSDVDYAENDTDDVATFAAMDPEGATISWTLEGTDADVFDISNGGVLTFKSPPDYETKTNYTVTVKATAGTDMATPHQVTVTVTDVNEALTAISGPSDVDYAENDTDDVATFISMDPEGATISWTLEGTDADVFDISSGGVLRFRNSPDFEIPVDNNTDNIYMVTVKASAGTAMDTHVVTVTVTDVDEVPTIAGDATIDYAENGTGDVATFTAMDPEETAISWSLAGDDAGVFDIVGGVLTFKESPDFEMSIDADTDNAYMVIIDATDATMKTGMKTVMVMVTDVEEMAPEMSLLERYDADGDSQIDRAELKEAIIHYIEGDIERDQLRTLIILFITG